MTEIALSADGLSKQTQVRSSVVTGSSRGIGQAIVYSLAQRGYNVCINHMSSKSAVEAEALADLIRKNCSSNSQKYYSPRN